MEKNKSKNIVCRIISTGTVMSVNTVDEIVSPGYYKIDACNVSAGDGFPEGIGGTCLSAYLEVSDTNHSTDNLKSAAVGQTLTYTNASGSNAVYHRSGINRNARVEWRSWAATGAAATTDIQDGAITAQKLSTDVMDQINNNSAAISAERTRAMGQEGLLNDAFEAERQRALQAENEALERGRQQALQALFVAAGAEYNDSGVDKTKTAPWGETVVHKAGHYYLNGLGDVTEEDMLKIYTRGVINDNEIAPLGYSGFNSIRTNLGRAGTYNTSMSTSFVTFQNTAIEILRLLTKGQTGGNMTFTGTSLFSGSSKLRVIDTQASVIIKASNSAVFSGCKALEEVRLKELSVNVFLSDSPSISKQTVKYAISNASATSAIAIKLHPDAYVRLVNDAEIVEALQAQPLVSLVSA